MFGLYIHIPFCASRCIYCGFYSTTSARKKGERLSVEEQYVNALCHEMELRMEKNDDMFGRKMTGLSSIYLGGGTPSQLSFKSLQKIFQTIDKIYHIGLEWGMESCTCTTVTPIEITMECNPDDVTEEFAQNLRSLPINRISMGAQTFSDERLHFLHRRHTADEVKNAVKRLRGIGIKNISVDLMFGFPNETLEEWNDDIERLLALDIEHISAYSLMYEKGTPLFRLLQEGKVKEIDEELYRQMYDTLIDRLAKAGYEQYEISNFAKLDVQSPKFNIQTSKSKIQSLYRSQHNSSYWQNIPYIGIGAAAHSYGNGKRSWNVADIKAYITAIQKNRLPSEEEIIDADTHYNDIIMTALRTCEGIDLSILPAEYRTYLIRLAKPFQQQGLLKEDNGKLHLTRNGIYVSDSIMSDLMKV
ncbi:MAG: radical SAM family heme chaperone HemW [Prevotella histicola]|uniref:radical SAM family heme chaperone HemW n=1 Tax=Prevotella histicola TaxID=470565 RepID=UPI001CAFAF04|nr:radical SAM family heme chaperone HemW [Prevotella histicola]MBF1403849.1 radical SAM family heme chaperone HemW [Prevotella histicola]MBF1425203.1 radical SAM family heme chaperone HemW [Prevotella histicola]